MNLRNALHLAPRDGRASTPCPSADPSKTLPLEGLYASPFSAAELRSRAPRVVALVLALVGIVWVTATDELLHRVVADPVSQARLQTVKGWTYVAVASLVAYAATAWSLSKLQRSEATLRAILRSIGDGVLLVGGPEKRVLDANPAAFRILGARDRSELIGLDAAAFSRAFRLSTLDGKLLAPDEYQSQRALAGRSVRPYRATIQPAGNAPLDGPRSTLSITVAPVARDKADVPTLAVSVMHDVTEAANLERMRERFFSSAAHALLTPLSTLMTHTELLLRADDHTPRERRHFAVIDRQCHRMSQIVRNLLVLARVDGGKLELHMRELDLVPLVERIAEEGRTRAGADVIVLGRSSSRIYGDEERLNLVLRNMLAAVLAGRSKAPGVTIDITEHAGRARVTMTASTGLDGHTHSLHDELDAALSVNRELALAHAGTSGAHLAMEPATAWFELPTAHEGRQD